MTRYIHQLPNWPAFEWDQIALAPMLAAARHRQGRLIGRMEGLGFSLQKEAVLETLTLDVLKSSEIEGEFLDPKQVRSSVARRLGMNMAGLVASDRDVEGVVEMMLDATQNFGKRLTRDRLFDWHAGLFSMGRSGMHKITVGAWRKDAKGPMQVVSGRIGYERVHYEAPPARRLNAEMNAFLKWVNDAEQTDLVLKAGIAHLRFVTIHPFDDGNGRIARAITDWLLAQSEKSSKRFYSMSTQIQKERETYYKILETTQKGNLDITKWLGWFLGCLDRAFDGTETALDVVFRKARFWEKNAKTALNERQRLMLNKLLNGFEGKLTSSKWAKLTKCSQDTAHRDIQDLIDHGILVKDRAGGRSTSYSLK